MAHHDLRLLVLGLLLGGIVAPPSAAAQEASGPVREEVEGLLEAYVISKLQDALELEDEQYADMIVAQKKLHEHRRAYRRERQETLETLRKELQSGASEDRLEELLEKLSQLEAAFTAQRAEDYRSIDAILSVRQQARYRVLELELERRMRRLLTEMRGRRNQRESRPR